MIETPLGKVKIYINDVDTEYSFENLETTYYGSLGLPVFEVTGRCKIMIDLESLPPKPIISCIFSNNLFDMSGINTGERLALKSWEKGNIMLSIGTEDDLDDREIVYLETGIKVSILRNEKANRVIFVLAWTTINDIEKEINYTWFAADPLYAM